MHPLANFLFRSPALLLGSMLLGLGFASCRERERDVAARSDSTRGGNVSDSVVAGRDSAARGGDDATNSLAGDLRWPDPSGNPELAEILRRSARLVEFKRRLDDSARAHRAESGQEGAETAPSSTSRIAFEDSLVAWIHRYGANLAQPAAAGSWPALADQPIEVPAGMASQLPKVAPSRFFESRRAFFLGGAPLLAKELEEDGRAFVDPQGKPEVRFSTSLDHSTGRLLQALRAIPGAGFELRPGPPLDDYESGPYGVGGMGSLDHVAKNRIQAWFLTASGAIPARVVSVRHNLFEPGICGSNLPRAVFASAAEPGEDIFGIFLPQDGVPPPRSVVVRNGHLTTVDLDGDGIPELAGVTEPFQGVASDELDRAVWFANLGGIWKPIDAGSHEDCT